MKINNKTRAEIAQRIRLEEDPSDKLVVHIASLCPAEYATVPEYNEFKMEIRKMIEEWVGIGLDVTQRQYVRRCIIIQNLVKEIYGERDKETDQKLRDISETATDEVVNDNMTDEIFRTLRDRAMDIIYYLDK